MRKTKKEQMAVLKENEEKPRIVLAEDEANALHRLMDELNGVFGRVRDSRKILSRVLKVRLKPVSEPIELLAIVYFLL